MEFLLDIVMAFVGFLSMIAVFVVPLWCCAFMAWEALDDGRKIKCCLFVLLSIFIFSFWIGLEMYAKDQVAKSSPIIHQDGHTYRLVK